MRENGLLEERAEKGDEESEKTLEKLAKVITPHLEGAVFDDQLTLHTNAEATKGEGKGQRREEKP